MGTEKEKTVWDPGALTQDEVGRPGLSWERQLREKRQFLGGRTPQGKNLVCSAGIENPFIGN